MDVMAKIVVLEHSHVTTIRGSSVVDYVLAAPQLFSVIKSFDIMGPYLHSDHCLLSFDISILQEK